MRDNYRTFRSWPLAITAYNHGPASIRRAINKIGSDDISDIIDEYQSASFGFASKNFYATFVAVAEIELNSKKYFPEVSLDPPLRWGEITLKKRATARRVALENNTTFDKFKELNAFLRPDVFDKQIYLPAGARLRIGVESYKNNKTAVRNIASVIKLMKEKRIGTSEKAAKKMVSNKD